MNEQVQSKPRQGKRVLLTEDMLVIGAGSTPLQQLVGEVVAEVMGHIEAELPQLIAASLEKRLGRSNKETG